MPKNNEWPLVFFTLISQFSVGVLLMFNIVRFVHPTTNDSLLLWWHSPEVLILVLLGIAGIISLQHLGKPINAPNSINNFAASWISKEILSFGFLAAMVFVLFLIRWVIPSPIWLVNTLLIISLVAGFVFIYSMSRIYTIETLPSWNTCYTPVSFFFSVILFALVSIIFMKAQGIGICSNAFQMKSLILLLIIFLMIHIGVNAFHQFKLSGLKYVGIEKVSFTKGMYFNLFIARTIILFVLVMSLVFIYINSSQLSLSSMLGVSLLVAIVSQELIGRLMFYQSYFRIGV